MRKELKKLYATLLLPSIMGFVLVAWAKGNHFVQIDAKHLIAVIGPFIFILCIALAVAFPIFYRTVFAFRHRHFVSVSEEELLKFERRLVYVVMITPYLALTAMLLELPRFYTVTAILMGLYAGYYFYPSTKRIASERSIFRVK